MSAGLGVTRTSSGLIRRSRRSDGLLVGVGLFVLGDVTRKGSGGLGNCEAGILERVAEPFDVPIAEVRQIIVVGHSILRAAGRFGIRYADERT
jgi:hypothetical protein